jgi:hypothetical protein
LLLYHASPFAITDKWLIPSRASVSVESQNGVPVRAHRVVEEGVVTSCVFATEHRNFALTYALPKGMRIANCHGFNATELLFLDNERAIEGVSLDGGLYSFESDDFIPLFKNGVQTDQYIATSPVDICVASYTPVRSLNDIMSCGVQILQIADGTLYNSDDFHSDWTRVNSPGTEIDVDWLAHTHELLRVGKLRWLNAERKLNQYSFLYRDDDVPPLVQITPPPSPGFF